MKRPSRNTLLYGAAALLSVCALLFTARTLADTPRALAQIARRRGDLLQLQGLAERHAANRAALLTVEATTNAPVDLTAWLHERQPDWKAELQERDTTPLVAGWTVRRIDLRLPDVTLTDAVRWLAEAEALRPPWRAVEIQIVAGATAGQGQLNLVLETLARKDSGTKP